MIHLFFYPQRVDHPSFRVPPYSSSSSPPGPPRVEVEIERDSKYGGGGGGGGGGGNKKRIRITVMDFGQSSRPLGTKAGEQERNRVSSSSLFLLQWPRLWLAYKLAGELTIYIYIYILITLSFPIFFVYFYGFIFHSFKYLFHFLPLLLLLLLLLLLHFSSSFFSHRCFFILSIFYHSRLKTIK